MPKLSIIIPSRNEKYLQKTIDSIFENAEGDVEVIVGLDGFNLNDKPIINNCEKFNKTTHIGDKPKLNILSFTKQIGQRALTNELVKLSKAQYIMKTDAHCIFSKGFDVEMLKDMDDKTILAPRMLCIDEEPWTPRHSPLSSAYCFDTNLVFQYNVQAENKELVNETPCLQGSVWMVNRKTYWDWNLCDESLGSWGRMGIELGIKAYLNGGICKTTKKCFYAHLFREEEKDFPYKRDKKLIKEQGDKFRDKFKRKNIAGLIEKFGYFADWDKKAVDELPDNVL